jgi:hypothetical protein
VYYIPKPGADPLHVNLLSLFRKVDHFTKQNIFLPQSQMAELTKLSTFTPVGLAQGYFVTFVQPSTFKSTAVKLIYANSKEQQQEPIL